MTSNVIFDEYELRELVAYIQTQPAFAYDTEAQGEYRGVCHLNDVTWMGLATKGVCKVIAFGHPLGTRQVGIRKDPRQYENGGRKGQTYYRNIPVYEEPPKQIRRDVFFEIVRPLFFDEGIVKSAHGAVFDIASTAKYWGEVMHPPFNCTIVMSWLLDENRRRHGLKYLIKDIYGDDYDKENTGRCVESHPFAKVAQYLFRDTKYAWLLFNRFAPQIKPAGLWKVYKLEMQILNVLVGMRLAGSRVDVDRLHELKAELADLRDKARSELKIMAGQDFNPNSVADKQRILFGKKSDDCQGLIPWKLTDTGKKQKRAKQEITGYSTDDEVLASYPGNPVASKLREYGDASKLLSTYVLAYLGNPEKDKPCQIYDGRIHADFVQYGTTTRRFSCREPNLQNIPRPDTELGKLIRGAWFADPGWKLIVADYSQIELVVFAHFAGKGALFDGFLNGDDPHQITADKVGIERQAGKTLNFSMSYGGTEFTVASQLNVDRVTARNILADHEREFPEIYELKRQIIAAARSREPVPYVKTMAGGIRRIPDINSKVDWIARKEERKAVSAVIQGSAADLIKIAMVRADSDPRLGDQAHLVLTVHDEIVMTAPEDQAQRTAEILHEAMTGPGIQKLIKLPLKADVKIVDRWSEAK